MLNWSIIARLAAFIDDGIAGSAPPSPKRNVGAREVDEQSIDGERVEQLLHALRERTPREITIAVLAFSGRFTPEMWRALELLSAERGVS